MDSHRSVDTVLLEITELGELKRESEVTKSVLTTAHTLSQLQNATGHFADLVKALRTAYSNMLQGVGKMKLLSAKLDKLWGLFHQFAVREGNRLCQKCNIALDLKNK